MEYHRGYIFNKRFSSTPIKQYSIQDNNISHLIAAEENIQYIVTNQH